jgi:hypothetical protein
MGELNYSARRVTRTLESKLGVRFEDRRERVGWYVLDNREEVRFKIPRLHESWGKGTIADIIRRSRLKKPEFRKLVGCPMTRTMYDDILRQRLQPS